jgi:hypothetical protein
MGRAGTLRVGAARGVPIVALVQRPAVDDADTRIVVLGGGVGGLAAARHLDRYQARRSGVEVTLVSRDNFFLLSLPLFEACSGVLEGTAERVQVRWRALGLNCIRRRDLAGE